MNLGLSFNSWQTGIFCQVNRIKLTFLFLLKEKEKLGRREYICIYSC
jgi:hypothetical protein